MQKRTTPSTRLIGGYLLGVGFLLCIFGLVFGIWLNGMESWSGLSEADREPKPRFSNVLLFSVGIVIVGTITMLVGLCRLFIPVKIKPPLDIA